MSHQSEPSSGPFLPAAAARPAGGGGRSRRGFLRQAGLAALVAGGGGVLGGGLVNVALPGVARAAAYDYTARATFDAFDRAFHDSGVSGQPDEPNEHGGLAWGQSYALLGFVRMYEAYRDTYYLDRIIHNVDLMLATRDSVRGVADYSGRSQPAWRAMHPYTVGVARLTDGAGQPVLEVRSALAYADLATATVRAGSGDGRFTLEVRNRNYARVDTFTDVTMDPASPDYVVRRIYAAYPSTTMVTARDLRTDPSAAGMPAQGVVALESQPVIFAVHTGMITYPLAAFVRLVYGDPQLRKTPRYKAKADEYLAAVVDAVAVHDPEWRQGEGGAGAGVGAGVGAGYFQWPKGMPVPYDGTAQPINQSVALGCTYAELAKATGSAAYRERVLGLATMYAAQLEVDGGGAYIWPYWPKFSQVYLGYAKTGDPATDISAYTPAYGRPGAGNRQYEDLSHGAIDVEFAVLAFRYGMAFRGVDLVRFARTYTRNLATTDGDIATSFVRVDGTGGLAPSGQYLQAPRWMQAAPWGERVFDHARAIYDDRDVQPGFGSGLLSVAYLNWYARRS
ncbi:hypothetical protein [Actinopolymorpha alba]|uniref:hypothetical protein n=1 Tax=Actinopolymorpha alba TaxID=533267 RepID=UPI0003779069|nr:hypothetical protein [Actinopolymorpha alba]